MSEQFKNFTTDNLEGKVFIEYAPFEVEWVFFNGDNFYT
jgi:hypothetical protein